MIARSMRLALGIAALVAITGSQVASACDSCNGGGGARGRSYSVYSGGDYGPSYESSGECSSCGGSGCSSSGGGRCRDASCSNEPRGCRNCPPNPDKVDCCDACGGGRKQVYGCGWRTWDLLGYWSCGGGCANGQGCGEIYRGDYASDPPACCDPCDGHGNWIGPGSGYRARYNPSQYVGDTYYDSSSDFTYSQGQTHSTYSAPKHVNSVRTHSAPSRLVPSSTTRRPTNGHSPQARQMPRSTSSR